MLIILPVALLLAYSIAAFAKGKIVSAFLPLLGSACLVIVNLTHIAEALRLFPAMGWGEPHSVGHYIDLTSDWWRHVVDPRTLASGPRPVEGDRSLTNPLNNYRTTRDL